MKPVLNYFVPFTNGKFVAQCLMFSDDVEMAVDPMANLRNNNWNSVEYSDIDYWWIDHHHDWFNTRDWQKYLTKRARESSKYQFYTCHEDYTVHHIKRLLPQSRIISIIPDLDLCKRNYIRKNWVNTNLSFEDSRVYEEFKNFKPITSDIVIDQRDLFSPERFVEVIKYLSTKLDVKLDLDQVLNYREQYFNHPRNQL